MKSVYCAVRTGSLNKAVCASVFKGIITWAANIPVCTSEYTIPPALKGNLHESKCPVPFWLLHTKVLLHKLYPVSFKKDCITIFWYTAWCNWADTYRSSMLYLKMEAAGLFETLKLIHRTIWDYSPFGRDLHMGCPFYRVLGHGRFLSQGKLESARTYTWQLSCSGTR